MRVRSSNSAASPNFPIDLLNQWEIDVLDKEMGRSGFQAWYLNPPRPSGDALVIAYQNAQGHWCRMCPDFLFFHGDSENIKVSIVDPHGHHLADADRLELTGPSMRRTLCHWYSTTIYI